jgi:hypothetical protein
MMDSTALLTAGELCPQPMKLELDPRIPSTGMKRLAAKISGGISAVNEKGIAEEARTWR